MQIRRFISFLGLLALSQLALAKPLVVASIKPLALIAQEIAGNQADVQTLIPVTASHHDHPLKVSDHNLLRAADLVIWVGPEMESFLEKPLANLPPEKLLGAYRLAGLFWPEEHPGEGGHQHERDPHLWLDPRNGMQLAKAITEKLRKVDAGNAGLYDANLQAFLTKTTKLDERLAQTLQPVVGRGFAVYHEGYNHFVGRYGLRQLDYVTYIPEQKPGAKHLAQLRKELAQGRCLFLEPYNDMTSARDLARELNLKLGTLDPLGSASATSYSLLLEQMASAFVACLGDGA
jgi:zinc transport system substrate-binding protein